jgi:hypothetical protein
MKMIRVYGQNVQSLEERVRTIKHQYEYYC